MGSFCAHTLPLNVTGVKAPAQIIELSSIQACCTHRRSTFPSATDMHVQPILYFHNLATNPTSLKASWS